MSPNAATVRNITSLEDAKAILNTATGKFCPSVWCGVEGYDIGSIELSEDGQVLSMIRDDGTHGDSVAVNSLNPQGGSILGQGVVHFSEAFAPNLVTTETEAQRLIKALGILKSAPPAPPRTASNIQGNIASASASGPSGTEPTGFGGLYGVEPKIPFNVLDSVYYDAASGELALIGHHDDRFKGAGIPYLQHLATLLESPKPEFSLAWTPDSTDRVNSFLARELTQQESDDQAARLGNWADSSGMITHTGALMLPALGLYPIKDDRAPGDLGVEVKSINGGRVVVMKVNAGSAAEKAGLKPIDFIVSVRPDRPVFFASEFERQVRFAGAGAQIEVTYERNGVVQTTTATLDAAADTDPWHEVNRYDLVGIMYRGAGDPGEADVIEMMGIMNTMFTQKEQTAGLKVYNGLMRALGMESDFQHLQEAGAGGAPPYDDSYNFGLKMSRQMDSIFHLAGSPLQNAFAAAVQQSHDPASALSQVFVEFDAQIKPMLLDIFDRLIFRPGVGFQIPPEIVEDEYHIHPEMTPEYRGVPGDSQLARLMLESDYLGKQLSNRQDLKRKILGYQTQIEYQITHPDAGRGASSAYRVWITIAGIDAGQSADGRMLALRDARMRFNIRQTDDHENDLPNQQPGGYEDVLTGLYDRFEQEFPALHELREAAKLAAVAAWMQKQNPAIRLPREGRSSWKGPETVDGLVYIYLTANLNHENRIIKIAEGGVSLVPYPDGAAAPVPTDSSVVDLRSDPSSATVFARPDTATVWIGPIDTGAGTSPYVASWVAPVASGTPGETAVVLEAHLSDALNDKPAAAPFGTTGNPSNPQLDTSANTPAVDVHNTTDQLTSAANSGKAATDQNVGQEASKARSNCMFDQAGCGKTEPIAMNTVVGQSPGAIELASHIPDKARSDKAIAESLAYYAKLDGEKLDAQNALAAVQKKIDSGSGDAQVLAAQKVTLDNDVKRYDADQANTKSQIKKRLIEIDIPWVEDVPPPAGPGKGP